MADDGPVELSADPPAWLLADDEPVELQPLPPDPLGAAPFARDADSPGAVRLGASRGIPPGELLTRLAPGPGLVAALESTDPSSFDLYDLVEVIAGYHRVESWAHARVTELAGQLARRPGINPHHPLPGGRLAADAAAAEIGPRLGVPRRTARRIVGNAALFRGKLDQTADALRRGELDPVKADTLARMLGDQPTDVAWEVQQRVLPDAAHQTSNQLTRAVQKSLIAVDPHRATQRHRQARDRRRVDHPRPLPDGMAGLYAVLPATDAAGLDLALEAAARSAKAAGDTRTVDQLRADALALLGHAALEQGYIGLPAGFGGQEESEEAGTGPSGTDGGGADTARSAGRSPDAHGSGVPDVPSAAVGAADLQPVSDYLRMLHMPVGTIGGRRAQIRVTVPLSALVLPPESQGGFANLGECLEHLMRAADEPGASPALEPPGASPALEPPGNSQANEPPGASPALEPPGASPALEPPGDGQAIEPPEASPALDPTPSAPDLGLAEVAELDGYGFVTPDVARALAMSGGTWERLVTDPLSGRLLDVGRTRYRPPAAVAEFVRARDRTCIVPTCSAPAHACDLDHVVRYPDGPTSAFNLGPLCGPDHRVKTLGAFELKHLGGGTFEWTTPSGHVYRRDHHGRVTWVRPVAETAVTPPPF
ncbi:MAG TPA: DUF222 domain-containing protein [Ornithinicoccus sp.]|nr:DUF222 domain-containing protein [Ornithinicoccus sp.]